ncbi:hypothetical protein RB595_004287 [Gaeumannomyces hyphopodioides]
MEKFFEKGGDDKSFDPVKFLERLRKTFGTRQNTDHAQSQLRTLRQDKGQTFGEYYPMFENVITRAGGGEWADAAKLIFLKGSLSLSFADAISVITLPTSYRAHIAQLHILAVNWKRTQQFLALRKKRTKKRRGQEGGKAQNLPRLNPSPGPAAPAAVPTSSAPQVDSDGDIIIKSEQISGRGKGGPRGGRRNRRANRGQGAGRRAHWVSQKERNKRHQEGRCLKCGASGHYQSDCPYKPAARPGAGNAAIRRAALKEDEFPPWLEGDEKPTSQRNQQGKE